MGITDFTFHNLRHTFASLQSDTGTDRVTTKELSGHSDPDEVQLDMKRTAIERGTSHVLSLGKGAVLSLSLQTGTA